MQRRLLAWLLAASCGMAAVGEARASCASSLVIDHCTFDAAGGGIVTLGDPLAAAGGAWWILGSGHTAMGVGIDSGSLAADDVPADGSSWLSDLVFFDNTTRCLLWDWSLPGSDGCGLPADFNQILVALVTDTGGHYAFMSVAGSGGFFDYDRINNGIVGFAGLNNGVLMEPDPVPDVLSTTFLDLSTIEVTVSDPPPVNAYDEINGARSGIYIVTLTADGVPVATTGGTYAVPNNSDLCWEIGTGDGFRASGCVRVADCPTQADGDGDGTLDCVDNCLSTPNPGQEDADGDGKGDACDPCPLDPLDDVDGDGVCGDVDNCPTIANANQRDQDNDGAGNECDCARSDGTVFATPAAVTGAGFAADQVTLFWDSATTTGGSSSVHDVLRGYLVGGPSETSLTSGLAAASLVDLEDPLMLGWASWYIIRGWNSCGIGTWGFESSGLERTSAVCP